MSDAISQVKQAAGPRVAGDQLPASALEHGALTLFDDNEVVFTGNGVNSPADVLGRVIEISAQKDEAFMAFVQSRESHIFAAQKALQEQNPQLKGQDPEEAVPAGQQFFARGGADLKSLLAPFKNNLGALRQIVADQRTAMGGRSKATGHGIFSQGLGLPAGGEPPAVASPGIKKL